MTVSDSSDKWQVARLKDLPITIIDGDRSARYPKRSEFLPEGIPFLNTTNIELGQLVLDDVNFVSPEKFSQIQKGRLQRLDIVMTTRGSIGKVALFDCAQPTGLINAQMLILRTDSQSIDPVFLFYLTLGDRFQSLIRNFGSGSAQPQIPITDLREIEISYPGIKTQRKIAAILSAYDDLIENNNRRIRILEEMAQMIYREWFISFRFPGHENVRMGESEMGMIPEGWEVRKTKEVVKRLKAGSTYTINDVERIGQVIVVDQSRDECLGFHNSEADHKASTDNPIIIFGDHTCKMQLMVEPFSVGPNVVPFESNSDLSVYYIFFLVKDLVSTQEYKRHWTELSSKQVIVSSSDETKEFASWVIPLFEYTDVLRKKNTNLRQTRDLLLPKLISGELDVSDLDISTSESASND